MAPVGSDLQNIPVHPGRCFVRATWTISEEEGIVLFVVISSGATAIVVVFAVAWGVDWWQPMISEKDRVVS